MTVDDEALGAGQLAVADRRRDAVGIPAAARLRHGQCRKAFSRRDRWQELFLLRRRSGFHDRGRPQNRGGKERRAEERSPHLLDDDGEFREGETLPAAGFGNVHRRQAEIIGDLSPDFGIVARFGFHQSAHFRRRRLIGQEPSHGGTQLFLLIGERELHGRIIGRCAATDAAAGGRAALICQHNGDLDGIRDSLSRPQQPNLGYGRNDAAKTSRARCRVTQRLARTSSRTPRRPRYRDERSMHQSPSRKVGPVSPAKLAMCASRPCGGCLRGIWHPLPEQVPLKFEHAETVHLRYRQDPGGTPPAHRHVDCRASTRRQRGSGISLHRLRTRLSEGFRAESTQLRRACLGPLASDSGKPRRHPTRNPLIGQCWLALLY